MRAATFILTGLMAIAAPACGGKSKPAETTAPSDKPLYDRLGGTPAITAVVDRFVAVTGEDPRISMFFTNADIPRLKSMMVEHICDLTGGPCTYTGKSMKESHTGMKVKDEHFAAFMEDPMNAAIRQKCINNPNEAKRQFAIIGRFYLEGQTLPNQPRNDGTKVPIPNSVQFKVYDSADQRRQDLVVLVLPSAKGGRTNEAANIWIAAWPPWRSLKSGAARGKTRGSRARKIAEKTGKKSNQR